MKNRLIPCVLACLMIFLVGCNGNTAKEAAQEITKTETSFPAGNTETDSQEETAEEPESTTVQEETPITANQPLKGRRLRLFRQNRRKKKRLILLQPKSQRQSHRSRQPRRLNPKNKRNSQKNRQLPNKSRLKNRLKSRQNRNRQSRTSRHSMSALMLVTQKSMR